MKLELEKIFSEPEFKYDTLRECYRPDKLFASVKFNYLVETNFETVLVNLALSYNSIQRPHLVLKINNKIIKQKMFSSFTGSYEKLLSIRCEEGPFTLQKGDNTIEIISGRIFPDIYNLEIYPHLPRPQNELVYYSYKMSDFVYLECYNPYGGFFWHINNFIMCCYFCEKFKKKPIVNFNRSLFTQNSSSDHPMIQKNLNWFYNYFQSYLDVPPSIYQAVLECEPKVRLNQKSINFYRKNKTFCLDTQVLDFRREGFNMVRENCYVEKGHRRLVPKYLKPLPHINFLVEKIRKELMPPSHDNLKLIGIHYRGTDKIEEELNKEQKPKHFTYQEIYDIVIDKAKELMKLDSKNDIYILGCSDEKPFLDFFKKRIRNKFIFYEDATRSQVSTSNLQDDFTKIPNRDKLVKFENLNEEQKILYQKREKLIDNSIHMGTKSVSNYKKGEDCLIDVLLLNQVDVLFQSKGNFSLYCEYFNQKENLEVIPIEQTILDKKKKLETSD